MRRSDGPDEGAEDEGAPRDGGAGDGAPRQDAPGGHPLVVGITSHSVRLWTGDGCDGVHWVVLAAYSDAVWQTGAVPMTLPQPELGAPLTVRARDVIRSIDALVLTDGPDILPQRYGDPSLRGDGDHDPQRENWELALLAAADATGCPVLGISRGMQLINVARGGSLVAHLPDAVGSDRHRPHRNDQGRHPVIVHAGTRVESAVGAVRTVPSFHHQAIRELGRGLRISAVAPDGTVEAIEAVGADGRADPGWIVGVQWHPESDRTQTIFMALSREALARRSGRARHRPAAGGQSLDSVPRGQLSE